MFKMESPLREATSRLLTTGSDAGATHHTKRKLYGYWQRRKKHGQDGSGKHQVHVVWDLLV